MSNIIEKIGTDRICHASLCALIATGVTNVFFRHIVMHIEGNEFWTCFGCWLFGVVASCMVGVAKEIVDYHTEGNHADAGDLIADLVGGALGGLYGLVLCI